MIGFPPPSGASRPDRSSMSLLVELTTNTLDEGYAEAARRRANVSREPGRGPRRGIALLVLAAAGLLLAVAAVQARHRAPATARARASLERDIARQVAATDALDREVRRQCRAIAAQRERALAATRAGADLAGRVATLELAAAQTPVRGPGVSVTLEDAQARRRPRLRARTARAALLPTTGGSSTGTFRTSSTRCGRWAPRRSRSARRG